ncbi:MAG: aminoglycoside phosphotransferase family protein, partial [Gemmatimonadota bacterium]
MKPGDDDIERARRALGVEPVAWRPVRGHGAPSTRRFVVELPDGSSVFVKIAAFDYVADWFRDEQAAYEALTGQPYLPRVVGWDDDGTAPLLALEDLSGARWPPPWAIDDVDTVLGALDAIHSGKPLRSLPLAQERQFGLDGWPEVARDPGPIVATGVCAADWLAQHIGTLRAASAAARIAGSDLLHFDVRSDNLCIRDGLALLVDWNHACIGNALLDT